MAGDSGAAHHITEHSPMTTETLTPEQLTARLVALEQFVPIIQRLERVVQRLDTVVLQGDPAIGQPSLYQSLTNMERRIDAKLDKLSAQVDMFVAERQDEKSQVKGISRALRIAGFTSVTSVVLFIIAVVAFLNRK